MDFKVHIFGKKNEKNVKGAGWLRTIVTKTAKNGQTQKKECPCFHGGSYSRIL
jgi:hypothetical protein